jgi:hypothetical protein
MTAPTKSTSRRPKRTFADIEPWLYIAAAFAAIGTAGACFGIFPSVLTKPLPPSADVGGVARSLWAHDLVTGAKSPSNFHETTSQLAKLDQAIRSNKHALDEREGAWMTCGFIGWFLAASLFLDHAMRLTRQNTHKRKQ